MLSKAEKDYLIDLLEKGEKVPTDFKYKLFPVEHKEYELAYAGKMRKEDLLADDDGSFPVPLQVEKIFGGTNHPAYNDGWHNLMVFGDNLQFLKTIYKDEDPIISKKVKGKIKLVYIDPPFATSDDFQSKEGAKAYTDKKKGSEFIEYIRKRLILIREVLSDDGCIFVHLDWKKAHYIKVILDEVFGESNFVNEIVWHYPDNFQGNVKGFANNHNVIFYCLFKTPVTTVLTASKPERKFVELLCKRENAALLSAWIKSRDRSFYEIEYTCRYGSGESKSRRYYHDKFNPDFFLKIEKDGMQYYLVIEIKDDGDDCEENKAKYKYAVQHFAELNKRLEGENIPERYIFHFLSPNSYNIFFDHLRDGTVLLGQDNFRCALENMLEDN